MAGRVIPNETIVPELMEEFKQYLVTEKNGLPGIAISRVQWESIKARWSRKPVLDTLNQFIEDNSLTFYGVRPTLDEALEDFNALRALNCMPMFSKDKFYSRFSYEYPMSNFVLQAGIIGQKSSNHFLFDERMKCGHARFMSPVKGWGDHFSRRAALNPLYTLGAPSIDSRELYRCVAMRKYIASQFKPSGAKAIYQMFKGTRILDPSAGWGDRLSGALATPGVTKYVGCDPNTALHPCYAREVEALNQSGVEVEMMVTPAEEADYGKHRFDLVFTSPPYRDTERYTKEETQSWRRYKDNDAWLKDFLFEMIARSWDALDDGGYFILNISDAYFKNGADSHDDRRYRTCDPMNDYIGTLPGANYIDCFGYRMQVRFLSRAVAENNVNAGDTKIFGEPTWVWGKGTKKNPLRDIAYQKSLFE